MNKEEEEEEEEEDLHMCIVYGTYSVALVGTVYDICINNIDNTIVTFSYRLP